MKIKYLEELNDLIEIIKDKAHPSHRLTVSHYKKRYHFKNCEEIIMQLENRKECLISLLEDLTQKDFEALFCFRNLEKNARILLYRRIMDKFSADFALYDFALSDRVKSKTNS